MNENFVSKELFKESMKNISEKLDAANELQTRTLEKVDKLCEESVKRDQEVLALQISDKTNRKNVETIERWKQDTEKKINSYENDKKWIVVLSGCGWTLTLTAVHIYLKYFSN